MNPSTLETRIRWSSLFIAAGLLVQVLSLLRVHPLSFVVFILIGCPLVGIGMVLYLTALVPHDSNSVGQNPQVLSDRGSDPT